MDDRLIEVKEYFEEGIFGFMIGDLKKSVSAGTNFLTALGCLTYTEVIGALLPPLPEESGALKERRFYRCFFRFPSADKLRALDKMTRDETSQQQGLYQHLRHSMSHSYAPRIKRRNADGTSSFYPVVIAKNAKLNGKIKGTPPMGSDSESGRFVFATKNYTNELNEACKEFYDNIINQREEEWVAAAYRGMDFIKRS